MHAWKAAALGAMLAVAPAAAQEAPPPPPETWEPSSTTAMAITGRVTLAPDRITFGNRSHLPLEPAGEVPGFLAEGQRVTATLFRVAPPGNPVQQRGSRLCGNGRPVRVIAIWQAAPMAGQARVTGPERSLAAFSGAALPKGTDDPENCGTFHYEVPAPSRARR